MTDLEPRSEFVNPTTGEVLSLNSPDGELGRYLADLRDLEGQIREHKRLVTRELLSRMDRQACWTVYEAGVKLSGASPAPSEEWDGAELYNALCEFVDAGQLSQTAVNAAVEVVVSYKPRKAGITALRKLGGEIAATVDRLAREVEKERRVTVSVS